MSNEAMTCAWQGVDPEMAPGPLFVLIVLCDRGGDHSGEDWTCYPSVEDIQKRTHYSRASVERHLAHLEAEGWLSRKRRIRPDGKLGIYDYTIHRRPEVRAALKAERSGAAQPEEGAAVQAESCGEPCRNLQHGPCCNLSGTMLQNGAEPCCKLQHQEPSIEPSGKPTRRVREPGDDGFDEAVALWPDSGRKRTRFAKARAGWAWACGIETAERLTAATAACAADPQRIAGDYGWPGFDVFLRDEIWRGYLPKPLAAEGPQGSPGPVFAGPAELRGAIVAAEGEAFARSYLDRARWLDGALAPATGAAAARLREPRCAAVLKDFGVRLLEPAPAAHRGN